MSNSLKLWFVGDTLELALSCRPFTTVDAAEREMLQLGKGLRLFEAEVVIDYSSVRERVDGYGHMVEFDVVENA